MLPVNSLNFVYIERALSSVQVPLAKINNPRCTEVTKGNITFKDDLPPHTKGRKTTKKKDR